MRANLTSVARLAGVSTSTASRALTGDPRVSPQARQRVLEAARSLRYRPNRIASGLRTRRTGLVGFALPDLRDPWWAGLTEALQGQAAAWGVTLLSHVTGGDPTIETQFVGVAVEHGFDGLVLGGRRAAGDAAGDHLRQVAESSTTGVTLGYVDPASRLAAVLPDRAEAARLLVGHLARLGHTRIGCLLTTEEEPASREQYAGFVRGLAEHGIALRDPWVVWAPDTRRDGGDGARHLLDAGGEGPTGLVVGSAAQVVGVLDVLAAQGVEPGRDLSVGLAEGGPTPHPVGGHTLTAIADQTAELGAAAWRALGIGFGRRPRDEAPGGDDGVDEGNSNVGGNIGGNIGGKDGNDTAGVAGSMPEAAPGRRGEGARDGDPPPAEPPSRVVRIQPMLVAGTTTGPPPAG